MVTGGPAMIVWLWRSICTIRESAIDALMLPVMNLLKIPAAQIQDAYTKNLPKLDQNSLVKSEAHSL
jgi:hypothetical protein